MTKRKRPQSAGSYAEVTVWLRHIASLSQYPCAAADPSYWPKYVHRCEPSLISSQNFWSVQLSGNSCDNTHLHFIFNKKNTKRCNLKRAQAHLSPVEHLHAVNGSPAALSGCVNPVLRSSVSNYFSQTDVLTCIIKICFCSNQQND